MANILYDNCFISSYKTRVKEVVEENGLFWHYLEETIFYVESGGMQSDEGLINQQRVLKLKKEHDKVWHLLAVKLEGSVALSIDFHLRFMHAQNHTAQHLISGLMENIYGYKTLSHHLHAHYSDIEFDAQDMKERQLYELQVIINGLIRDDLRVGVFYPTKMEMGKYNIKNPGLYHEIRMVKIGEITTSPCGCIHVPSLRYLQMIHIDGFEKSKNGIKIKFVCGDQMLHNYERYYKALCQASKLLAQPFDFIELGVLKLMQENKGLQADNTLFRNKYVEALIENKKMAHKPFEIYSEMDLRTFSLLCNTYAKECKEDFIFLWKQESRMHVFIKKEHADEIFEDISQHFRINGTRSVESAQGGGAYQKGIEEYLTKIVEAW